MRETDDIDDRQTTTSARCDDSLTTASVQSTPSSEYNVNYRL